jgi:acetate kinase
LREKICENSGFLDLFLDKKNNLKNKEGLISEKFSKKIFMLKTDEEKMIFEKIKF